MKNMQGSRRSIVTAAILTSVMAGSASVAGAQHVTPAMAAAMGAQGPAGAECEGRARQAATLLGELHANLERAGRTGNEPELRAVLDAVQKGFTDLKGRLGPCLADAQAPAAPAGDAMAGMDHSKMTIGSAKPPASAGETAAPAGGAMAGMDHSKMNMGGAQAPAVEQAGAAAAPTKIRQISGPAEAALQALQDGLQVGNREVTLQWLLPDATISEAGVTDGSRDAYATEHMAIDMAFLKTAKVVLLDRQVHPAGDSTHIVSTSRITGRAGEVPVDVRVTEEALLKKTRAGWRVATLEWTIEPREQRDTPSLP